MLSKYTLLHESETVNRVLYMYRLLPIVLKISTVVNLTFSFTFDVF